MVINKYLVSEVRPVWYTANILEAKIIGYIRGRTWAV